jgi:branched-chain amino acid transport system permease protein
MASFGFWQPVIIFSLLNVILVSGLYVTALSGQLSMATAAFAGIGGYVSAVLTTNFDWPFVPAILVAAAAGAGLGTLLALLTIQMRDFILKLTTLAFGEAMSVIAFNIRYIGGANGFSGIPLYTTLASVVLATCIAVYIAWRFDGSRLGFAARAVRDDPLAAASSGVSIREVRIITFALGSAIIAAGGAMAAHYVLVIVPSQLGFFYSLTYIIFLLCGGMQALWGPIFAAVLLTAAPELLRFTNEYRLILYGLIIVVVVMWRPDGLITRTPTGSAAQWLTRLRGRLRAAAASPRAADLATRRKREAE